MQPDRWHATSIPGVLLCEVTVGSDARGSGRRVTDSAGLRAAGVEFTCAEGVLVTTHPGALRGMHAQLGVTKTITCLAGAIHEVALDLRPESPAYGRHELFELSAQSRLNLCLPSGVAHGFLALGDSDAVTLIQTSPACGPAPVFGVHWDSFGYRWPLANPVVSDRDAALPPLAHFQPTTPRTTL